MTDETMESTEPVDEQQPTEVETEHAADDEAYWKAEARKWEKLAKQSLAAERELAELKDGGGELAEVRAHAAEVERELAEARAAVELHKEARSFASVSGVPVELLEFCSSTEEMEQMAKIYKEKAPRPSIISGRPFKLDIENYKRDPAHVFAEWAMDQRMHPGNFGQL